MAELKEKHKNDINLINQNHSKEINELKNQIKDQIGTINELKNENKNQIGTINELKNQIKNHIDTINELKNKYNDQENRIIDLESKYADLLRQNDELNKKIKCQTIEINKLKKTENDELKLTKSDSPIKKQDESKIMTFNPSISNLFQGIINYLTQKCEGNVHKNGIVEITSSSTISGFYPFYCVDFDNKYSCFESNSIKNSWLCFDFKGKKVKPSAYSIRTYGGGCNLQSWRIDGSNDKINWTLLDKREKEKSLDGTFFSNIFYISQNINSNEYYRYLRIQQTDVTTGGNHCLNISGLEYFGSLL